MDASSQPFVTVGRDQDGATLTDGDSLRVGRSRGLDLAGVAIASCAAGWTLLSGAIRGGSPWAVVALYLASFAAFVLTRFVGNRWGATFVAAIATVTGVVLAGTDLPGTFSRRPAAGALGYANAKAALFVEFAIAAAMLATSSRRRLVRIGSALAGMTFAAVPIATHALAASLLMALGAACFVASHERRALSRAAPHALAAGLILCILVTALLGAEYAGGSDRQRVRRSELPDSLVETFGRPQVATRLSLWHDAMTLMDRNALFGVGPSMFRARSPAARRDRDTRWAHNEYLQQGAETGVLGIVLLALFFVWGLAEIASARMDTVGVLGSLAIASLGLASCVDYLLHFPVLVIIAAVLAGTAASNHRSAEHS